MSGDRGAPLHIRVGLAGWSFRDGEGRVSPTPKRRASDSVTYLPQSVDTNEMKSTCSRIPSIMLTTSSTLRVSDHPDVPFPVTRWQGLAREEPMSAEERGGCAWMPISRRRLPTSVMS
jgi:hypothetical protein